jgi:hypothetical protein
VSSNRPTLLFLHLEAVKIAFYLQTHVDQIGGATGKNTVDGTRTGQNRIIFRVNVQKNAQKSLWPNRLPPPKASNPPIFGHLLSKALNLLSFYKRTTPNDDERS